MKVCVANFNLYLALILSISMVCGCQTEKSRHEKLASIVRVHLEASRHDADDLDISQPVTLLRATPVTVTVSKQPVLTEANVVGAALVEWAGGFAVAIKFDENGTWILEHATASNPGKHLVVFGQWDEKICCSRWLGAPLITHRIADGKLIFTADASRDEMEEFVLGLNNVARKVHKETMQ